MTEPRKRTTDAEVTGEQRAEPDLDGGPELNVYEIHADRTVLTEPDNTDGWIATDTTVAPPE